MSTRREFLTAASGAIGLSLVPGAVRAAEGVVEPGAATVLFQGDSITDWGRDRKNGQANNTSALGGGYPLLIASALLEKLPARNLRFYNRGVSGNGAGPGGALGRGHAGAPARHPEHPHRRERGPPTAFTPPPPATRPSPGSGWTGSGSANGRDKQEQEFKGGRRCPLLLLLMLLLMFP